jgi:hypothetical protein
MAETKEKSISFADLPLVSVLPAKQMKKAKLLLEELEAVKGQAKAFKEREEEINGELRQLQSDAKLPGLRFGTLAFKANEVPGRKTLNVDLLIEEGVEAATIQKCYKTGASYWRCDFKKLEE